MRSLKCNMAKALSLFMLIFSILTISPMNTIVADAYSSSYFSIEGSSYMNGYGPELSVEKGYGSFNLGAYIYRGCYGTANGENILSGVSFKSSNTKVATVNGSGVVKFKKVGSTKITVKCGTHKLVVTLKIIKNDSKYSSAKAIYNKLNSLNKTYGKLDPDSMSLTQARNLMNGLNAVWKSGNTLSKSYKFQSGTDAKVLTSATMSGQMVIANSYLYNDLKEVLSYYQASHRMSSYATVTGKNKTIKISYDSTYSDQKFTKENVFALVPLKAGNKVSSSLSSVKVTYNVYQYCKLCKSYHSDEVYTTATGTIKVGKNGLSLTTKKALKAKTVYYVDFGGMTTSFVAK